VKRLAPIVALTCFATAAAAEDPGRESLVLAQSGGSLFKCEREGRVSYSDRPCDDGRLSIIEVAPAPAGTQRRTASPQAGSILRAPSAETTEVAAEQSRRCEELKNRRVAVYKNARALGTQYLHFELEQIQRQLRHYGC